MPGASTCHRRMWVPPSPLVLPCQGVQRTEQVWIGQTGTRLLVSQKDFVLVPPSPTCWTFISLLDKPAIYSLITSLKPKTWCKDRRPVSLKGRSSLPGLTGEKQKQKDPVISPNTRLQSSAYCFTLGPLPKSLAGLKSRLFHILLQPSHHSRVNLA